MKGLLGIPKMKNPAGDAGDYARRRLERLGDQ
jgi:hypothetical protein